MYQIYSKIERRHILNMHMRQNLENFTFFLQRMRDKSAEQAFGFGSYKPFDIRIRYCSFKQILFTYNI